MAGENINQTESLLNPAIPQVQEDTRTQRVINEARRVSPLQAPKSEEYALSGLSSVMGETIHGLDTAQKIGLDEQLRQGIEKIKSDRIGELKAAQGSVAVMNAQGVLPEVGKPLPQDVQNLPQNLQLLKDARANGKMSSSEYDGKLRRFLSDVRAANPGYRDYIDDQGKKIIGYDPANAEIKQRLEDINALLAHKMDERKFIMQQVAEHYANTPHAAEFVNAVARGEKGMADFIKFKAPDDLVKKTAEDAKNNEVNDKFTLTRDTDLMVGAYSNKIMHDIAGPNLQTGEDIMKKVNDYASGRWKPTPEEAQSMGANAKIVLTKASAALQAWGSEPITMPDGHVTTRISAMGETEFKARVDRQLAPLTNYLSLIGDQEYGPAHAQARMLKNIVEGKTASLLTDKDIGDTVAATKALTELVPGLAPDVMKMLFGNQTFSDGIRTTLALKEVNAATKDEPVTGTIDLLSKAGVTKREVYDTVMGWVSHIKDPDMDPKAKATLMWNYVSPQNIGLMNKFEGDTKVKDRQGFTQSVPVRYSYYTTLFDSGISLEVAKMPAQVKQAYYERATESLGILFTTDARTLQDAVGRTEGAIHWNAETGQFIRDTSFRRKTSAGLYAGGQDSVDRAMTRINLAIDQYKDVLKATHPDYNVNHEILKQLETMGLNPDQPSESAIGAVYHTIVNAIKSIPIKVREPRPGE